MSALIVAQEMEHASQALRVGNAWVVLLVVALTAFGLLVVAARALRPSQNAGRSDRAEGRGDEIDPWEEAGRRMRMDSDDGTIRHDGVRHP